MKVLHLSTSDINGGAARGAYWMHKALQQVGIDSWMLVAEKNTNDGTVVGPRSITGAQKIRNGIRQTVEYWPLKRYPHKRAGLFSPAIYPSQIVKQVNILKPDIINLHWIGLGFLKPEYLPLLTYPIVWTLRDMWSFTGGCYYADACTRYQQQCGQCPALGSKQQHDLSYQLWQRKKKSWHNLNFTLVPVSNWLADCVRQSSLLEAKRIEVIHNAVDTNRYRPVDQKNARSILQLPLDKKIIMFGAIDPTQDQRKGFQYLVSALRILASQYQSPEKLQAIIFGADEPSESLDLGIDYSFIGRLYDDVTLTLAYSAADVMVVPSTQEAFGKTAIEAMACGTPVVSFDSTGLKDIVMHYENGYRAKCFSAEDLATGIMWVIEDSQKLSILSRQARLSVEERFTFHKQAVAYKKLYENILDLS